jgi:1,4-alpha-glucan branching enzyme
MSGRLVFVMHAHLPYVLGQGQWPHGEAWLYEAAVDTYLPLQLALESLVADGVRPALTIEISPVLGEQLDDDRFRSGCRGHLDALIAAAERNRSDADAQVAELAERMLTHYRGLRSEFERRDGKLLDGFRALDEAGHIELFTCARTHGFLPLLGSPRRVEAQVTEGVAWFEQRFGRAPAGMWMPECAYRPGLEEVLGRAGIRWTIVDAHLVTGGQPIGNYPPWSAGSSPGPSPHEVFTIGRSNVAGFARDPTTTLQVWSGDAGYPGDPWYLEFHKKHHDGGVRYWRVTDRSMDLGEKPAYVPVRAQTAIRDQGHHFANLVAGTIEASREAGIDDPVVLAPYDAELFGHWWREGIEWFAAARRELDPAGVVAVTASEAVTGSTPQPMELPAGSWGGGGDFRVWDRPATQSMWERVHQAEAWLDEVESEAAVTPQAATIRAQLRRTVLLIESSDWQFLRSTGQAADYAEQRVAAHHATARHLWGMWQTVAAGEDLTPGEFGSLAAMQERDRVWLP